jgi:hypothetical protein
LSVPGHPLDGPHDHDPPPLRVPEILVPFVFGLSIFTFILLIARLLKLVGSSSPGACRR